MLEWLRKFVGRPQPKAGTGDDSAPSLPPRYEYMNLTSVGKLASGEVQSIVLIHQRRECGENLHCRILLTNKKELMMNIPYERSATVRDYCITLDFVRPGAPGQSWFLRQQGSVSADADGANEG